MDLAQQENLFRRALTLLHKGLLRESAVVFRELEESGCEEPVPLSYCGLLAATVGGERRRGLRLCEKALRLGGHDPEIVLNLVRLYESGGARVKAVKLLRFALRSDPRNPAMLKLIERLSPRARPPLSVVPRNNPLNKYLAILLAKATGRFGTRKDLRLKQLVAPRRRPRRLNQAGVSPR